MKKLLLIIPFLLIVSSCDEAIRGYNYDVKIVIWLKDKTTGADLLNPITPNAYNPLIIKVFALSDDGIKTELYNPTLDAPRNFSIFPYDNNGVTLNLFKLLPDIGTSKKTEITKTIIEWKEGISDTLTTEINRNGGSTTITKVWYKNKVVFEMKNISVNNTSLPFVERLIEMKK
jgi:hypothetical protein